ncbi:MAG: hypothetical protein ABIJ27_08755 [Candidatus Omnitrophota bacterium]
MQKILPAAILFFVALLVLPARADESSLPGTMDAGAESVFSIEFYTDANVLHGAEGFSFSNINPTLSFVQADGRSSGDGKSDNGVVVKSNLGQTWYLKMSVSNSTGFNLANFKYYMGRPWNRTLGIPADGTLPAPDWCSVPTISTTVYTAGPNDRSNLVWGTLATYSYAINPMGMRSGVVYVMNITYTISLTA